MAAIAGLSVGPTPPREAQDPPSARRAPDSLALTGESDTSDPHTKPPKLVPRLDYFQASIKAHYRVVMEGLVERFAVEAPTPQVGYRGYALGVLIPTRERGTLTVNPGGSHDYPAVRVSGWPSDDVAGFLRDRWDGQASRVDAAVDFAGDLGPWCDILRHYAEVKGVNWRGYHVGMVSTGLEIGAGKSESRTRCYDAALKHPDEFSEPTGRLEHEWKPGHKDRKAMAYGMDPSTVLGTSRAAAEALQRLAATALPSAPPRTERVSDLERWMEWHYRSQGRRLVEVLDAVGGDLVAFARVLLRLPVTEGIDG